MRVVEARLFRHDGLYPVCPQCRCTIEREYQGFCDRCGQALDWDEYDRALITIR